MAIEHKAPERIVQNVAAGFVPAALKAVRQEVDPLYRETEGITDALMNRVPGLSSELEPRLDVLGEPMSIDPDIGPDIISPISFSKESTDPVRKLFGQGLTVSKPKKRIQGKGLPPGGIDLNAKEYSWLVRRQGETAAKLLNRIARNPKFQAMGTEHQQAIMDGVFSMTRRPLREALRESNKAGDL